MRNYAAGDARHWEIKTTIDKTIQLQFEKSVGFEIEYHRRCFYDKLFVYGADKKTRFARICGPKNNQESGIIHTKFCTSLRKTRREPCMENSD